MNIDKIFQSKLFKGIVLGVLMFFILLLVLKVGMFIGAKRVEFSQKWSDNYHQNFGGPRGGFMGGFGDREFIDANGTFGQIIKIDSSAGSGQNTTLVVNGRDNVEKVILINDQTIIRRLKDTIKASDLKVNEYIVVIGEPNDAGQIVAKLIRVMPDPGTSFGPPTPGLPL